jgi:hypothetical protein
MKLAFRASLAQKAVPAEQIVRLSADWPRLAYQAVSDVPWLTAAPELGSTPRQGSAMAEDMIHVRADPNHLSAGIYKGILTISAWQALQALRITVELTVTD